MSEPRHNAHAAAGAQPGPELIGLGYTPEELAPSSPEGDAPDAATPVWPGYVLVWARRS